MRATLLTLLIFAVQMLSAQELPFLSWSTSDGLAQSQARCLYQDHLGYIWVGTLGGVSRFNGAEFENFSRQNGLLGNQINAITEMGDSLMVFGSNGGLTFYNGHVFTTARFPEELGTAQVNNLYVDAEGTVWVACEEGSIRWKGGKFLAPQLIGNHVKRHFRWKGEMTCVAKGGIVALNDEPEVIATAKELDATIMDAQPLDSENLLIATIGNGLALFNTDSTYFFGLDDGLVANNCTGIEPGMDNTYWVKSRDGFSQVHYRNGTLKISAIRRVQGLVNSDVRAILCDENNDVWLGTNGGGISKFVNRNIQHYSSAYQLGGDIPMAFALAPDSAFWIGTYDNGITRWKNGNMEVFGLAQGLLSSRVWSLINGGEGILWAGTSGGLSKWDGERWTTYTTTDGLPHKQVLSLLQKENGDLLIGTARGLVVRSQSSGSFVVVEEIPRVKIRSIDQAGAVTWLATNVGVFSLEGKRVMQWTENEGLPDNSVFCLFVSKDGGVWIGTESGLCRIESGKLTQFPLDGGFGANHINFIGADAEERLWLGTNDGVFVGSSTTVSGQEFTRMGRHEGITHLETNQNAFFADKEAVWIGTSEALTKVGIGNVAIEEPGSAVETCITDIRVALGEVNWTSAGKQSPHYGTWPQGLEVPYDQNHFTFYVDAPSLKDAGRIRFQYKLDGLSDEWEPITESRIANYSQLPFSDFVFRARAISPGGKTGPETRYAFTVEAPFWLSWWFIALEVLLGALVLFLILRSRQRAFMEKVEKERLEFRSRLLSLEQQTLNSSMNRHFIFNALNSIQYYINRQDKLAANRYLSNFARLIRKNLDSSQVNFTSLKEEIERLELYLQLEHMRFQDKFEYAINIDEDVDQEAIKVPAMLLQPFLENSIWHGILPKEEAGKIDVHIGMHAENEVRFTITDDGIGIETSRNTKAESGEHISQGMSITSGRIDLLRKMTRKNVRLNGPYEWKNEEGVVLGTRVELILPVDFQEFYAN